MEATYVLQARAGWAVLVRCRSTGLRCIYGGVLCVRPLPPRPLPDVQVCLRGAPRRPRDRPHGALVGAVGLGALLVGHERARCVSLGGAGCGAAPLELACPPRSHVLGALHCRALGHRRHAPRLDLRALAGTRRQPQQHGNRFGPGSSSSSRRRVARPWWPELLRPHLAVPARGPRRARRRLPLDHAQPLPARGTERQRHGPRNGRVACHPRGRAGEWGQLCGVPSAGPCRRVGQQQRLERGPWHALSRALHHASPRLPLPPAPQVYLGLAWADADGTVHLPATYSPEYPYPNPPGPTNDTNFDLTLFSWGLVSAHGPATQPQTVQCHPYAYLWGPSAHPSRPQ